MEEIKTNQDLDKFLTSLKELIYKKIGIDGYVRIDFVPSKYEVLGVEGIESGLNSDGLGAFLIINKPSEVIFYI